MDDIDDQTPNKDGDDEVDGKTVSQQNSGEAKSEKSKKKTDAYSEKITEELIERVCQKQQKPSEEFCDSEKSDDESNDRILPNVKEYQSKQDDFTCLMPTDLSSKVIVNSGNAVITKETGDGRPSVKIAPGENHFP